MYYIYSNILILKIPDWKFYNNQQFKNYHEVFHFYEVEKLFQKKSLQKYDMIKQRNCAMINCFSLI